MDLSMVTEILGLVRQGQIEQAMGQITAAVSILALPSQTRKEVASRARGSCLLEDFGICTECSRPISSRRLASTNLAATLCTACFKK